MFNFWMAVGEIPDQLRQSRTIFVAKTDAPKQPSDYRPISIASVPLRHLHTILARRLLDCCPPDVRQRGFIHADGTLENTAVLDAVLGDSRRKLRECHVAVLDFSRAFDTVSHKALLELLGARGLPKGFCDYLARMYETATTILAVNGKQGQPVKVGRGVRQGDPLSPILFNMAMDGILASLPKGVGYGLEGERVSALAYADDLILLAGSKVGMQESIDCVVRSGEAVGLYVNRSKSSVLSMVPDGHRKKHHYPTENLFSVGRKKLRQVTCVERWRYLGVDFDSSGSATFEQEVCKALDNISRAPLKPQQRLELVRGHLIPKFMHGLVLGQISDDRLRMLDVRIRGAVRKWLRLPADVPVGYYHASVKDGGLGVPSFRVVVPAIIERRYGGLAESNWPAASAAARTDRIRRKLRWARRLLRKFGMTSADDLTSVAKYWREKLHASTDGFELRESSRVPASTEWIRKRSGQLAGRDYVQSVHCHINALPSRIRASRGRRDGVDTKCRAGCVESETTAHIIQRCFRTHGGRIKRHDFVTRVVAEAMTRRGWSVELEPRIATSLGHRKPDVIAVRDGVGVILDTQVVSGQRPLDDAHRAKRSKYGKHEELVKKVAGRLGLPSAECVRSTSCTISWRGVWSASSVKEMKELLGLDNSVFGLIPSLVLRGSHTNWTRFNQMTSRITSWTPDRA